MYELLLLYIGHFLLVTFLEVIRIAATLMTSNVIVRWVMLRGRFKFSKDSHSWFIYLYIS